MARPRHPAQGDTVAFRGGVWTDDRGYAAVRLPDEAPSLEPPLEYVGRGAEEVVCSDPAKLGYLTVWAGDYLARGHRFAAGRYDVGGPVGTASYYAANHELRLDQPLTITQANLGEYGG